MNDQDIHLDAIAESTIVRRLERRPLVGERVRINGNCPWPERQGLVATVTDTDGVGCYPVAGLGPREIVLLVHGDPYEEQWLPNGHPWSCVLDVGSLDRYVPGEDRAQ